jgi:hypothetical protein
MNLSSHQDNGAPVRPEAVQTTDASDEPAGLTQARWDAELTASADPVRAYLQQIGKIPLLNAEQEVDLAKRIVGQQIQALQSRRLAMSRPGGAGGAVIGASS